jgi:hypothetical protein
MRTPERLDFEERLIRNPPGFHIHLSAALYIFLTTCQRGFCMLSVASYEGGAAQSGTCQWERRRFRVSWPLQLR